MIDKSILAEFAREELEFPKSSGSFDRFVAWRTMKLLEALARAPLAMTPIRSGDRELAPYPVRSGDEDGVPIL